MPLNPVNHDYMLLYYSLVTVEKNIHEESELIDFQTEQTSGAYNLLLFSQLTKIINISNVYKKFGK